MEDDFFSLSTLLLVLMYAGARPHALCLTLKSGGSILNDYTNVGEEIGYETCRGARSERKEFEIKE